MADPRVRNGVDCICQQCGTRFKAWPSTVRAGQAKHCSAACANLARHKAHPTSPHAGHLRAQKRFSLGQCERCDRPATDRHHKDNNPLNNDPRNILRLCRRCHMAVDGRLDRSAAHLRTLNRQERAK
jgi:hypothetical protein